MLEVNVIFSPRDNTYAFHISSSAARIYSKSNKKYRNTTQSKKRNNQNSKSTRQDNYM